MKNQSISILIPIHNEENNIEELLTELDTVTEKVFGDVELILIDDCSSDNSIKIMKENTENKAHIKIVENKFRMGQGLSIYEGSLRASHSIIAIMDGDLQVNPLDMCKLLQVMEMEDLDFICSKRKSRKDEKITKHLPSLLGNILIKMLFKADLTDIGSSLKIVKKEHFHKIKPFKNYHRYISIFLHHQNLNYIEHPVEHRIRKNGASKYSVFKFIQVIFELFIVKYRIDEMKRKDSTCVE